MEIKGIHTFTGSLSIRWAKERANGSLIFSTSLGRNEGNPPAEPVSAPVLLPPKSTLTLPRFFATVIPINGGGSGEDPNLTAMIIMGDQRVK